jgi:glycosyltransferase involved in cell wall biosynthesis
MRVAFITTDGRDLLKNYASTVPDFGTAPQALLQGFAQLPDVEVHVVSILQQPVRSPEKLADNIFFHGLLVPKIGWLRTGYQGCIRAVRKKLKEIRPDIVHGQGTERDCAISAAFSGHPNVITIHGNMAELARRFKAPAGSYVWLAGKLENFVLKRTGGVFCNSAYTEGLVGPRAKKTWRVPNALRTEFFSPQQQPPAVCCQMLNIGVITPRKHQLELLNNIERLRSAGMDFHFRFVGEATATDDYTRDFLEKIGPLQATGVASHSAPMGAAALVAELDRSHALVHFPSEEAFGLVVAESLARGCKFFGAHTGGIVDITADVEGTELYEVDDWDGLVSGIVAWMRNGFERSAGGARQMRDRYSPLVVARRHLEIYREILGRR